MGGYSGVIDILDRDGQPVGKAGAVLVRKASRENPLRWSGQLAVPSTPALAQWLKSTRHDVCFRTADGLLGACVSYRFPRSLPASIDVFGGKDAPFE